MSTEDKSVALVGLPDSGKTVLLTALFQGKEWNIQPLSKETFTFLHEKKKEIEDGKWPAPTPDNIKAKELVFRVTKNSSSSIILKSRDFAGESWKGFINKYGDYNSPCNANSGDEDICNFLKNAAAVAICIDLEKFFDGDLEQKWMIQAVLNYLEKNDLSTPVSLVITKYDKIAATLKEKYKISDFTVKELIKKVEKDPAFKGKPYNEIWKRAQWLHYFEANRINHDIFGRTIALKIGSKNTFFVAAVQEDTERYSREEKKCLPKRNSGPIGINPLETWIFDQTESAITSDKLKKARPFLVAVVFLIAAVIIGTYEYGVGMALAIIGIFIIICSITKGSKK